MAAIDVWQCTISGAGGHGAAPHLTRDPVVAAAQVVSAWQSIQTREIDTLDPVVITVGKIRGGDAANVIPDEVRLAGSLRTYRADTRNTVLERMQQIGEGLAGALRCEAKFEVMSTSPAVVNDGAVAATVREVAAGVVGAENVVANQRTMISEDVSRLMDDIPGCFFFVGTKNSARGLDYPHHNPRFDIDEAALPIGAAVLAGAAARYLFPT